MLMMLLYSLSMMDPEVAKERMEGNLAKVMRLAKKWASQIQLDKRVGVNFS